MQRKATAVEVDAITFTIIIPVKEINSYILETVQHVQHLDDADWELFIVVDEPTRSAWADRRIKLLVSGRTGPAAKRDLATEHASGDVLVFLDDDSYPRADLLSVARPYFERASVVAVGGPALTPPEDSFWQQVSGCVFVSRFSGGFPERYLSVGDVREVEDWPSVNMMVRKSAFIAVGGFDTEYWPGEDTKLCLELIRTGGKILYVPNLIVWHHRRASVRSHLRQVGTYGLTRGFFAKRYRETSLRLKFFLPSVLVAFCVLTLLWLAIGEPRVLRSVITAGWAAYSFVILKATWDVRRYANVGVAICTIPYIVSTHLVYGAQFVRGFALVENLRVRLR